MAFKYRGYGDWICGITYVHDLHPVVTPGCHYAVRAASHIVHFHVNRPAQGVKPSGTVEHSRHGDGILGIGYVHDLHPTVTIGGQYGIRPTIRTEHLHVIRPAQGVKPPGTVEHSRHGDGILGVGYVHDLHSLIEPSGHYGIRPVFHTIHLHVGRPAQSVKPPGAVEHRRHGGWPRGITYVHDLHSCVIFGCQYGIRPVPYIIHSHAIHTCQRAEPFISVEYRRHGGRLPGDRVYLPGRRGQESGGRDH